MLWPTAGPVTETDVIAAYTAPPRPLVDDRPWVVLNMVASIDGGTADAEGRSGGLGGPVDKVAFRALRSAADVILAGAATVRTEDYGPAVVRADLQAARVARGQAARPRIAVVSASLDLDPNARLFGPGGAGAGIDADPSAEADARPIVVTHRASDPERRRRLDRVAEVVVAGDDRLDWLEALAQLRARTGAGVVLVEGGPSINGQLLSAELVDEVCLSLAPLLVGGPSPRVAHGPPPAAMCAMTLAHAVHGDGFLLLRYLAARHAGPLTTPATSSG